MRNEKSTSINLIIIVAMNIEQFVNNKINF